jgi:hypothetical protein
VSVPCTQCGASVAVEVEQPDVVVGPDDPDADWCSDEVIEKNYAVLPQAQRDAIEAAGQELGRVLRECKEQGLFGAVGQDDDLPEQVSCWRCPSCRGWNDSPLPDRVVRIVG